MLTRLRYWPGLCAILVFWTSVVSSAGLSDELARCAAVRDDAARLSCYDGLASSIHQVSGEQAGLETPTEEESEAMPEDAASAVGELTSVAEQPDTQKVGNWLGIKPYRRNYILPVTYNDNANDQVLSDFRIEDVEMKFQLSFELPVWKSILDNDLDLYFAYTQLSFFQAYNQQYSSPFRDTVYEPELGLNWKPGLSLKDWDLKSVRLALNHQSNGRTEPLSRSWNRLIGQFEAERGNLSLGMRVWHRFQEDKEADDNPDITSYLGHGELFAGYDLGPHRFGLMLRNVLDHGAVQLGWSRLLNERMRFYVQYFNGYGESLIDYDRQVQRLGIGFLLNEWP